jgi:hypothetical protein
LGDVDRVPLLGQPTLDKRAHPGVVLDEQHSHADHSA